LDAEENSGIAAGYTYLGQFIDHDLTFDPASSLQKQNDPDGMVDFRTPRFDLDSVYGRGPDDQPYLYEEDGVRMLLGRPLTSSSTDLKAKDVPRGPANSAGRKRALIGDPRNDENVIISQLQATMLRFHNRLVQELSVGGKTPDFATVQQQVRWHYQWVVLNDFLPTIAGHDAIEQILPNLQSPDAIVRYKTELKFYKPKKEPFIPVEFSVAAYRFGHSMVRPIYRLSKNIPRFMIFDAANETNSLTGFREFQSNWAIDWELFFELENRPALGPDRVQRSYKIDSSLVNPLGNLPSPIGGGMPSLALRNLLRSVRMGLPSAQAVASKMGISVIPDTKLRVGKATEEDSAKNPLLTSISPEFVNNAPLWYYVLAEAQQAFMDDKTPIRLGPIGARIVAEVFIGLLEGDSHSFLRSAPTFSPLAAFVESGKFGMAQLIKAARAVSISGCIDIGCHDQKEDGIFRRIEEAAIMLAFGYVAYGFRSHSPFSRWK
jgi:hypothetical protein